MLKKALDKPGIEPAVNEPCCLFELVFVCNIQLLLSHVDAYCSPVGTNKLQANVNIYLGPFHNSSSPLHWVSMAFIMDYS